MHACADDLRAAAYLACGKIAPEHEGLELSVGGSAVSTAIREATGVTRQRLSALYKELGDPGDVAEACRHTQVRAPHSHRPTTSLTY
jgi:DNA ligase-1